MLHIAVCDSSFSCCSQIEESLEKTAVIFEEKFEIEVYGSEEEFKRNFKNKFFDLIFIEIELNSGNGIEIGRWIREELQNDLVQIVYLSCEECHAMKLFPLRPLDFLIKPLSFSKIFDCITVLKRLLRQKSDFFEYQIGYAVYRIPITEILYFENSKRKINIITADSSNSFYGNMDEIAQLCGDYPFTQIHKSYLVNEDYIKKYEYNQVTLVNGVILPISQPNRKKIRMQRLRSEKNRMGKC